MSAQAELVLRRSKEERFPVWPGNHELQLKVDWMASPAHQFTAGAGDTIEFSCGGGKTWRASIDLFSPSIWIQLERDDT